MNRPVSKTVLIASLVANFAAAIFFFSTTHHARPVASFVPPPDSDDAVEARTVREQTLLRKQTNVITETRTLAATNAPLPQIWNRVESADHKTFVANLRAIGCPETTIRDIVMLDLFKTLGEQMSELARKKELPFWQTLLTTNSPAITNEVRMAVAEFASLAKETLGIEPGQWFFDQSEWIQQAFGNGGEDFAAVEELFDTMGNGDDLNWMDPQRRRALALLRADYQKRINDLERKEGEAPEGPQRDALVKKVEELNDQQEKAEKAFLTPAEQREMELRDDYQLKQMLTGVSVTRSEFEQLHALTNKPEPDSNAAPDAVPTPGMQPWYVDGTPEQAQAKRILGDERYAQFKRAADPKFNDIASYATSMNLPLQMLNGLDDIRRAYSASIRSGADPEAARSASTQALDSLIGSDEKLKNGREGLASLIMPPPVEYTLKINDSLDAIASEHNITAAQLLRANGVTSAAQLQPGQVIKIPQ